MRLARPGPAAVNGDRLALLGILDNARANSDVRKGAALTTFLVRTALNQTERPDGLGKNATSNWLRRVNGAVFSTLHIFRKRRVSGKTTQPGLTPRSSPKIIIRRKTSPRP